MLRLGTVAETFNWTAPKGGSTAFPSLKQAVDAEEFCLNLVERKGVLLLPSTYFDYGKQNFRIGLGRKNLSECIEKLDEYLQSN